MADAQASSPLLRVLGLGFGLAVVIGGVVGSGILRNPGVVAAGLPDPRLVLVAWIVGGLFVAVDAMPTVELGAAIPRAGGPYALASRALGPYVGFIVGWADWLQLAISTGFIAVAFGEYVHRLGWLKELTAADLAIGLVLACAGLNWAGTRAGGASQQVGSALKAVGLLVLVVAIFLAPGAAAAPRQLPPAMTWAGAAIAFRAIYGAYGGWQAAVYFSEEVRAPERNVARATFSGIAVVTALYLLVNAAVLHVLPVGELARSTLAVGDAARVVLGARSAAVVTGLAIIAVASLANLQIMEHVRSTFAMSRAGVFPPRLACVSRGGTPRSSLAVVAAATIAIILGAGLLRGPLYDVLLNLYAPMIMVVFLVLAASAIRLRRAEPDLPRPWRMPLFPAPALLSATINLALLLLFLVSDWKTGVCSALLLAAAAPIYEVGRARRRNGPAAR